MFNIGLIRKNSIRKIFNKKNSVKKICDKIKFSKANFPYKKLG